MKILFVILFGCLCNLHNGFAQTTEENPTPTDTAHCATQGTSCYDCNTLQYCSATGEAGLDFTVSCKIQNANRPYCDATKVECVADDVCEDKPQSAEPCYKNGTRPDPTDCTRYVQCAPRTNGEYLGTVVKCPKGTIFSVGLGKCVTSGQCLTIDRYCTTANAGKLIAYPPYPSIYAKCPETNSNQNIIVKLCKGDYTFNAQAGVCQPVCTREGYIPNNENCLAYYNCVRTSNGAYSMTSNVCPENTGFNRNTLLCDENSSGCTSLGKYLLLLRRKRDLLAITGGF